MIRLLCLALLLAASSGHLASATEFSWSGTLEDGGTAADGHYDFQVQVFSSEHGGFPVGEPVELPAVAVTAGAFSASLEFADGLAAPRDGWIEVAVRGENDADWRFLPGRTALAAKGLVGGCPASWNLAGNAGVLSGDFLGTTDAAALQFRVGNQRALRIVPGSSPSLIGGYAGNLAGSVVGASICGGGASGAINQVQASFGSIGGGQGNRVDASWGTIGGGRSNRSAGSVDSTIGGGASNEATGQTSTVGGGFDNVANALVATVAGGLGNLASGDRASIGGGEGNTASGSSSTVPGGFGNTASGSSSVVGGGSNNIASGGWSAIAGGTGNRASGTNSSIAGGNNNVASGANAHVAGGGDNLAAGSHSGAVGEGNCTGGSWSWVGGRGARLYSNAVPTDSPCYSADAAATSGDGTFMWAGGNAQPMFLSYPANSFVVRATGGTTFWSDELLSSGVRLAPGAGDWSTISDRNAKDDIEPLDTAAVLDALARMPVYRWRWKTEAEGNRHIGPMAQDFHAAYGLNGDNDRHLLSVDTNGVALAAIQGLNAKLERENAELRAQLAALDERQQRLEARLQLLDLALRTGQATRHVDTPRLAGVQ